MRAEEALQNEQKELSSWFERYAIDECVDPLLGEILFLQQFFTRRLTKTHYGLTKEPEVEIRPMPYQACVRIFAISGALNFTMLASIARLGIPSTFSVEQCQKYMKSLNLILIGLIRLRQYLVGATITAKNDVHRLCVERRIQALGEMFDKEISEMGTQKPAKYLRSRRWLEKWGSQLPNETRKSYNRCNFIKSIFAVKDPARLVRRASG